MNKLTFHHLLSSHFHHDHFEDLKVDNSSTSVHHQCLQWPITPEILQPNTLIHENFVRKRECNWSDTNKNASKVLAPVVQRVDNTIYQINHYPVNGVVCFTNTYSLDSELSGG